MKKYVYLLMMICCAAAFISCDDDDDIDEAYKKQNEDFILNLSFNAEYTRISSQSNGGYIYYKVLKEGDGTEQIYYTSTVKVYYQGSFIDGTIFDAGAQYLEGEPKTFSVSNVVDGFSTALQRMKVGDKWDVWMPWELGYGSDWDEYKIIPPYSALHFEIEVVEIVEQ